MLKSEVKQVPLQYLRDGAEYPLGNINMRKEGGKTDLGPLRASLRHAGQLQNMVGSTYGDGDEVYLIIGNRRRVAAEMNQDERPQLSLNAMDVRVYADLTVADAIEIGLSEKVTELPHHELDQYEAFAALAGKDPREIAEHFDCSERLVKQRMKLGGLSAKIRAAFRAGEIDRPTAEAFTMGKDHKAQDKAFDALKRTHGLNARTVRARLLPDHEDVQRFLRFASGEFEAAGGVIFTDLFQDDHGVSDPALLKQVGMEKLGAVAANYVSSYGFGWADLAINLPDEFHGWKRKKAKAYTLGDEDHKALVELQGTIDSDKVAPEERRAARVEFKRLSNWLALNGIPDSKDRADSGVVIALDGDGGIDVVLGVIRPKAAATRVLADQVEEGETPARPAPARAGDNPVVKDVPPRLSHKSQTQRAIELTDAVAVVLKQEPDLALVVLLAGLADRGSYGPIRASVSGAGADALHLMDSDSIADNLPRLKAMKPAALLKMAASAAAASLTFQAHSADRAAIEDPATRAILALLPPAKLASSLKVRFEPDDYFGKSLPKEFALAAIRDCCGAVIASQREGDSAADLRAFALANCKGDWLPAELRFPGYAGPGAKKAKAAPTASPKAKTKAKAKSKKGGR